ncbi:hypothetical protein AYO44_14315 [Planctomycetaceae bacterium SCGC AG-212-F19]|nr:hypothetical protein AYO44_14315 [Planctomycetaceae bacterium SCGC AG-212-F19]
MCHDLDTLSPKHAAMPERLVQAAVQAGLYAARHADALPAVCSDQATWLARMACLPEEVDDNPSRAEERGAKDVRLGAAVVGFDAPAAEGTGHVPWYAD